MIKKLIFFCLALWMGLLISSVPMCIKKARAANQYNRPNGTTYFRTQSAAKNPLKSYDLDNEYNNIINFLNNSIVNGTMNQSDWAQYNIVPVYISNYSFSVTGDATSIFHTDRAVRFAIGANADSASGFINSSSYGAGITTVLVWPVGLLNTSHSRVQYGVTSNQSSEWSLPRQLYAKSGYGNIIYMGGDNTGGDYEIGMYGAQNLTFYWPNSGTLVQLFNPAEGGWNSGHLWHSGNDGTTSTMDSDLLDGVHASSTPGSAIRIPVTNAGGYLNPDWIEDNAMHAVKLQNESITDSKIAPNALTGGKIYNATITGNKIADGTITGSNIQNSSITGIDIQQNSSIMNAHITDSLVGYDSYTIGATSDYLIPAGKRMYITGATGVNLRLWDGAAWQTSFDSFAGGFVWSDGAFVSFRNNTGAPITIYWYDIE